MGWKILLPQEIMSEGRKLLKTPATPSSMAAALRPQMFLLILRNISRMP